MYGVDLKIPPVECAVPVVVIDFAFSLWVFGPLDRECDAACRTKLLARVLLVCRERGSLIALRFVSIHRFRPASNHQRRLEAHAHRRSPVNCVLRMYLYCFVNAKYPGRECKDTEEKPETLGHA